MVQSNEYKPYYTNSYFSSWLWWANPEDGHELQQLYSKLWTSWGKEKVRVLCRGLQNLYMRNE
jgi:hypothetical protein